MMTRHSNRDRPTHSRSIQQSQEFEPTETAPRALAAACTLPLSGRQFRTIPAMIAFAAGSMHCPGPEIKQTSENVTKLFSKN